MHGWVFFEVFQFSNSNLSWLCHLKSLKRLDQIDFFLYHNMVRVILAPKERFTLFDLRTQTFRVHVELSTYYHRHARKINFRAERLLTDIFSIFFSGSETVSFWPNITMKTSVKSNRTLSEKTQRQKLHICVKPNTRFYINSRFGRWSLCY